MHDESDLMQLQRQVELVQTAMRPEEFEASVEDVYCFRDRFTLFPRRRTGQFPVRVDRSEAARKLLAMDAEVF